MKIEFPMTIRQIPLFEKLNSEIYINFFTLIKSKRTGYRAYVSKKRAAPKHNNLLMFKNNYLVETNEGEDDEKEGSNGEITTDRYHFCWIKDLSRLISSTLSKI